MEQALSVAVVIGWTPVIKAQADRMQQFVGGASEWIGGVGGGGHWMKEGV